MAAKKHVETRKAASKPDAPAAGLARSRTRRAAKSRRESRRAPRARPQTARSRRGRPCRQGANRRAGRHAGRRPGRKQAAGRPRRPVKARRRPATLARERRKLLGRRAAGGKRPCTDDRLISSARAGHDELRTRAAISTPKPVPRSTARRHRREMAGRLRGRRRSPRRRQSDARSGPRRRHRQGARRELPGTTRSCKGGDEITERDKHRWELDPASSDDWPHRTKRNDGMRP